jgi:hypothetical protein
LDFWFKNKPSGNPGCCQQVLKTCISAFFYGATTHAKIFGKLEQKIGSRAPILRDIKTR